MIGLITRVLPRLVFVDDLPATNEHVPGAGSLCSHKSRGVSILSFEYLAWRVDSSAEDKGADVWLYHPDSILTGRLCNQRLELCSLLEE